ncbi:pseudouridine synthase [Comamonadaceae bacterium OH2545_COT-014]|nr:pseudouridine synthase [Comamonadaceae bacterium OH2545_COT-014]
MTRPARPAHLPVRDGVGPSTVALPPGPWPLLIDFLAERLPAVSRQGWHERMTQGEVVDDHAQPLPPATPYRPGQRVHYWRRVDAEPPLPATETVLYQDDWLVVADKPHFMPVTPSGPFVQQSLLVRLRRRLGLPGLSPIHRIDRDTAGLVVLAVQPATRAAYQNLFRDRQVEKVYEAIAPDAPPALTLPRLHQSRLAPHAHFFTMHEVAGPPNSMTRIERLHALPRGRALYRLEPVTGKRHQLRAHMAALGLPLENDPFYPAIRRAASDSDDWQHPLQLLARHMAFTDPCNGAPRRFESRQRLAAASPACPPED